MNDDNKNINNEDERKRSDYENGGAGATGETEEIVPEEDENVPRLLSTLREKLKECEGEKQEYLNGWQRAKADFVNFKKRSEEEKKEFIKFANRRLIEEIIPVLESFEMAFSNKKIWESLPGEWRKGIEYIHSQFLNVLKDNGLKELNPTKGERFDPNMHIAESSMPTFDKKEDNVIIQVVKKGYSLDEKIIMPPRVVVAEYEEKDKETMDGS